MAVLTLDGAVFRGPQLVSGGSRDDARGILETKREIKDLRERIDAERDSLLHLAAAVGEARVDRCVDGDCPGIGRHTDARR